MELKNLTNEELYSNALSMPGELYSEIITELQKRNSYDDIQFSIAKSRSGDDATREIAIDTLAQIAFERDLSIAEEEQIKSAIYENLNTTNESLLESTITAAGNRCILEAIDIYENLQNHKNSDIRFSIAFALGIKTNEKGIDILINLSRDENCEVRDWATFALGSQIEDINNKIIDALLQRVNDDELVVAGEAIVGLANKNYAPVDAIITEKLNSDSVSVLIFEACIIRKNPIHYDYLKLWENILDDDHMNDVLHEAMDACSQPQ